MSLTANFKSEIKAILAAAAFAALCSCSPSGDSASGRNAASPSGGSKPEPARADTAAKTEISFWHSMDGSLGKTLSALVDEYNASQGKYKVNAQFKGGYAESMNAGVAAYRAGQAPDILQVFEVGTATMIHSGGAIKPVYEIAAETGVDLDAKDLIGAVASYYSDKDGKLISMPFNSSTPVMYYNKDAFKKAGLDPEIPPKTYGDLKTQTKALAKATGCGYTTTWPAWLFLETFSAWHNVRYATENNGFGGLKARIDLTDPVYKRLFSDLKNMSSDGSFVYGGRADNAYELFVGGKCAMMTGSSASYADISQNARFDWGVAPLPYYGDVPGAPQNTIIGGASLWVFSGKGKPVYEGAADFFKFLARPENAAKWSKETGYVPVTRSARDQIEASGFYKDRPGADVAIEQLDADVTDASRGVRLGNLADIRNIEEGVMERMFADKISVDEGLKEMQDKSNAVLERFEKDHANE